jgi:tRNA threonylcarbamoyl adenosine modification protein YeaZ
MITRPVLAIDTATSHAVIVLAEPDARLLAADVWAVGQRHSEELLPRIIDLLEGAALNPSGLGAIVVGTGPGAFTGLRVGLATAKTLAHQLGLPLAGVSSAEALLLAAAGGLRAADRPALAGAGVSRSHRAGTGGYEPRPVLLLPAGSTDRVIVRAGRAPALVPGGLEPELEPGEEMVAVDLAGRSDPGAATRGEAALHGLPSALVSLGAERLMAGQADDPATLVPQYVTPPRGVTQTSGAIAWSRDRR